MASSAMRASAFKPTVGGLRARCVASRVDGTDGMRPIDRLIHRRRLIDDITGREGTTGLDASARYVTVKG